MKTTYGDEWHVFDWEDKEARYLEEIYIVLSVIFVLGMLLGGIFLLE